MRDATRREVDDWWATLFGLDSEQLWHDVTVLHPHGQLGDYDGWYVAWREAGLHVSAPTSAEASEVASLRDVPLHELQEPEFWHAFAHQRGLEVVGPAAIGYLDEDPGLPDVPRVEQIDPRHLTFLERVSSAADWVESGLAAAIEDGAIALAAWIEGTPKGGAVLRDVAGAPRDIGLLVATDARTSGVGTALGQAAASYAIGWHGWARWRCRETNVASARIAEHLGFEPYATQLAVRRGSSPA